MRLAPLYQQDRTRAIEEGKQQGLQQGLQAGLQAGLQQGTQQGEANLIIRQLNRRFQGISVDLEGQIRSLPVELLESLGEALFDFQAIEDVLIWLENHP